jgi:hypothetical protein
MQPTAKIIVQEHADQPEQPTAWLRFVAVLCFIWFYYAFVGLGNAYWSEGFRFNASAAFEPAAIAQAIAIGAIYLCGRSLWYGGRLLRWWLPVAAIVLAIATVLKAQQAYQSFGYAFGIVGMTPPTPLEQWLNAIGHAALPDLPLISVLITACLMTWQPARFMPTRCRPWTVLAAVWIVATGVPYLALTGGYLTHELQTVLQPYGLGYMAVVLELFPYGFTAALVLLGHRLVRTAALIMAGIELAIQIRHGWILSRFVYIGILALLASTPGGSDSWSLPYPFGSYLFNQMNFNAIFVNGVFEAGPWLLIAVFAWRVPMPRLPEDGSPFPRRYCGKCRYNLHGLDTNVCPECGAKLQD